MKNAFTILIIVLAVLSCGCTAAGPAGTATPAVAVTSEQTPVPALPDLTGTWTGPMAGYDEKLGFTDYPGIAMSLNVTEQQGRLFSGHLVFISNGTRETQPVAGVIARDGRAFSLVEQGSGYSTGIVLAKDEIELTYMFDGPPYSVAVDTLKRV
jgi:hypothetical protein